MMVKVESGSHTEVHISRDRMARSKGISIEVDTSGKRKWKKGGPGFPGL
jgi:hypothetical protein